MNRRNFLRILGGTALAVAIEEAIPLNRVWSFPSKIVVPTYDELNAITLRAIREQVVLDEFFQPSPFLKHLRVRVNEPEKYVWSGGFS